MIIDDKLLYDLEYKASESPRLRMNHNLHESLESPCQRLINFILPGSKLNVHRHTAETYMVIRGALEVIYYNDAAEEIKRILVSPKCGVYGVNIPTGQWHTINALEPTAAFSVKIGPYKPSSSEDILSL